MNKLKISKIDFDFNFLHNHQFSGNLIQFSFGLYYFNNSNHYHWRGFGGALVTVIKEE